MIPQPLPMVGARYRSRGDSSEKERAELAAYKRRVRRWIYGEALPLRGCSPTAMRAVFDAILYAMGAEGWTTRTYQQIAGRAGCSRRTAIRVVKSASAAGYLEVRETRLCATSSHSRIGIAFRNVSIGRSWW